MSDLPDYSYVLAYCEKNLVDTGMDPEEASSIARRALLIPLDEVVDQPLDTLRLELATNEVDIIAKALTLLQFTEHGDEALGILKYILAEVETQKIPEEEVDA